MSDENQVWKMNESRFLKKCEPDKEERERIGGELKVKKDNPTGDEVIQVEICRTKDVREKNMETDKEE